MMAIPMLMLMMMTVVARLMLMMTVTVTRGEERRRRKEEVPRTRGAADSKRGPNTTGWLVTTYFG